VAPNHCRHVHVDGIGRRKILDVNQGVPPPQCGPPLGGIDAKAHLLLGSEGSTREARGSRVSVSTASVELGWPNRAFRTNGSRNRCGTTERHGMIHLRKNTGSGRVIREKRHGNGCARTTTASISCHIPLTRRIGFVPSVPGWRRALSITIPTHPTRYPGHSSPPPGMESTPAAGNLFGWPTTVLPPRETAAASASAFAVWAKNRPRPPRLTEAEVPTDGTRQEVPTDAPVAGIEGPESGPESPSGAGECRRAAAGPPNATR